MAKTGVDTSTIIHKGELSKGSNVYVITREEKKKIKAINKKIDKKSKCHGCLHNKQYTYCLEKRIELENLFYECDKRKKI